MIHPLIPAAFYLTFAAGLVMVIRNRPILWGGLTPRGCLWWFVVAYGILGGLVLTIYTVRWWKRFEPVHKVIFGFCVAFAVLCFGSIVVTWIITRH